jgi:transposase-like protein
VNLVISDLKVEWTKLVSALLLVFGGGYLPLLVEKPQGSVVALAALMAAFGGALLAEALKNTEQAAKDIYPRINSVNRLLATVTSKIGAITAEGLSNDPDNLTAQKIGDLISILRTVVTDLSDITGQKFDPSVLNETIDSIGRLITELEQGEETPQEQAVISSLKDIFEDLQSKQAEKISETVKCPHPDCNEEDIKVSLGVAQASTTATKCPRCDRKFNVHRVANGGVITREMKPAAKTKVVEANA